MPRRAGHFLLCSFDFHLRVRHMDMIEDPNCFFRGNESHGSHQLNALIHGDRVNGDLVRLGVADKHGVHDGCTRVHMLGFHHCVDARLFYFVIGAPVQRILISCCAAGPNGDRLFVVTFQITLSFTWEIARNHAIQE